MELKKTIARIATNSQCSQHKYASALTGQSIWNFLSVRLERRWMEGLQFH
ncbi:UNVERIFIED_CONTAM: hypothetical protein FKN15_066047 [Acipenser sinensis]